MRHRKAGVKLNRTTSHRKAMFRNMVTSFFKYEHIRTTDAKAKALRRLTDQMITLAKRGDLHARRQALSVIRENAVVHKLFEEIAERYKDVRGGYTRVVKIGPRPGDAAPMSMVELVVPGDTEKKKKAPPKGTSEPGVSGMAKIVSEHDGTSPKVITTVDSKVDPKTEVVSEATADPESGAASTETGTSDDAPDTEPESVPDNTGESEVEAVPTAGETAVEVVESTNLDSDLDSALEKDNK